jgi:ABC-type transporter Mla MlaB component
MLRITVDSEFNQVSIMLEGSITGIWVDELERSWRSANAQRDSRPLRLDLSDVDQIDKAGKYLLALVHCYGAELIASGVSMIDLVLNIEQDWPLLR